MSANSRDAVKAIVIEVADDRVGREGAPLAGREHERELCRSEGRTRRGKRVEFLEQFGNRKLHLLVVPAQSREALIPGVDREYHTALRGQDRIEQRICGFT